MLWGQEGENGKRGLGVNEREKRTLGENREPEPRAGRKCVTPSTGRFGPANPEIWLCLSFVAPVQTHPTSRIKRTRPKPIRRFNFDDQ